VPDILIYCCSNNDRPSLAIQTWIYFCSKGVTLGASHAYESVEVINCFYVVQSVINIYSCITPSDTMSVYFASIKCLDCVDNIYPVSGSLTVSYWSAGFLWTGKIIVPSVVLWFWVWILKRTGRSPDIVVEFVQQDVLCLDSYIVNAAILSVPRYTMYIDRFICLSFIDRSFNIERILDVILSCMKNLSPN